MWHVWAAPPPGPQRKPLGEQSYSCGCLGGSPSHTGTLRVPAGELRVELEEHAARLQHLPLPSLGSLVLRIFLLEAILETISFLGLPYQMTRNN